MSDLRPAATGTVPIVLAFSDSYTDYAGTLIASIIAHASARRRYEFIVLSSGISDASRAYLSDLIEPLGNLTIRFVEVGDYFHAIDLHVHAQYSAESYFRLAIPDLLPDYDKLLYLDVDMVVLRDVADLFDIDIGEAPIAAAPDFLSVHFRAFDWPVPDRFGHPTIRDYYDDIFDGDTAGYGQTGVLLMQPGHFRRHVSRADIALVLSRGPFLTIDQDALNLLLKGRMFELDARWNVFARHDYLEAGVIRLPTDALQRFLRAMDDPWILHFAGDVKPWASLASPMAHVFWRYACLTPRHDTMLAAAVSRGLEPSKPASDRIAASPESTALPSAAEPPADEPIAAEPEGSGRNGLADMVRALGYLLLPVNERRRRKRRAMIAQAILPPELR